jgi:hypothetical protein
VKTIEITVAPNGQTKVETKGFTGAQCRQASRFIESALGQAVKEELKPEFHVSSGSEQQLRQSS